MAKRKLFKTARRPLAFVMAAIMTIGFLPFSSVPVGAASDGSADLELRSDIADVPLAYEISPSASNGEADPVTAGYTVVTEDGAVSVFDGLIFTEPGTYMYRVVPVPPEAGEPGVDYDCTVHEVVVTVDENLNTDVSEETLEYRDAEGLDSVDAWLSAHVSLEGRPLRDGMYTFELDEVSFEYDVEERGSGVGAPAPDAVEAEEPEGDPSEHGAAFLGTGLPGGTPVAGSEPTAGSAEPEEPDMPPMPDAYYTPEEPDAEQEAEPFTVTNTASGLVAFGSVTYTVPGTYAYEMRQVVPEEFADAGIYDTSVIGVIVDVYRDEDGALRAGVSYTRGGVETDDAAYRNVVPEDGEPKNAGSVEGLIDLDIDVAGAAIEYGSALLAEQGGWSFDIYYVKEKELREAYITDDFSLKYQMELHTNRVIQERSVTIRIPEKLFDFRDGTPCLPTDVAVPEVDGADSEPVPARNSLFNYYVDVDEGKLVFFNYEQIPAGTTMAWQVVYGGVEAMTVPDMSSWELQASGTVGEEEIAAEPLTGTVDTTATLLSLTKRAYSIPGRNYGPGLYTEAQVRNYIGGDLPDTYAGENFKKFHYVVWEVTASGSGTQPFDLWIKENPDHGGQVVGYKDYPLTGNAHIKFAKTGKDEELRGKYSGRYSGNPLEGYENIVAHSDSSEKYGILERWSQRWFVVMAYGADSVTQGMEITNTINMTLVPADLKDECQTQSESDTWSYQDYKWEYKGRIVRVDKDVMHYDETDRSEKWQDTTEQTGWLEVYKNSGEKDLAPDFEFLTETENRSFEVTHEVDGENIGERKPGAATRTVTVDDAVYCYNDKNPDQKYRMDGDDYYFSSVTITQTDYGYDVMEDQNGSVETAGPEDKVDQGLKIYAMFADMKPKGNSATDWELVTDKVDWPEDTQGLKSVALLYSFTSEQLARKPFRVMVVHDTINYSTICTIRVKLHIRPESPTMRTILETNPDLETVEFENLGGVAAQALDYGSPDNGIGTGAYFGGNGSADDGHYIHDHDENDVNYQEEGLKDFTETLYGVLLMRDNATGSGSLVDKDAGADKTAKMTNDNVHGRTEVVYSLTAYEGYLSGIEAIAQALVEAGVEPPDRRQIVFYDLLPLGMNFDPSYTLVAGRLTDISGPQYKEQPALWDTSGVTAAHVETVLNYKGTGRTLLKFNVEYDGDAVPYSVCAERLLGGWGLQFRGYWDWENVSESDLTANVAAALSAQGDKPFITDSAVKDDGNGQPSEGESQDIDDFEVFGADIDGDGDTQEPVLFSRAKVAGDIAMAGSAEVRKTVRADSDPHSKFTDTAVVRPGETYTYDITVTNMRQDETNIVIFDRLDNAAAAPAEGEQFEDNRWSGTFKGVNTSALTAMGVSFTVYYSMQSDALLPADGDDPDSVFAGSSWTEAPDDFSGVELSAVKAVAVRLADDFQLESGGSVSVQIMMQAPESVPDGTVWAYNNAVFSSQAGGSFVSVTGTSARTRLGDPEPVEIVKEYENEAEIPAGLKDARDFMFQIWDTKSGKDEPFSYQEFDVYEKLADGSYSADPVRDGATNGEGELYLRAGQKAVFRDVPGSDRIRVEEVLDPFWEPIFDEDHTDGVWTIRNRARSVLYVTKNTSGGPSEVRDSAVFTFKLEVGGGPASQVPYWIVDRAYTDGRLPEKLDEGVTGADGTFTLKSGQTAAIIGAGPFGATYTVTETSAGGDWVTEPGEDVKTGTFDVNGSSETFTNYYKWKELELTKLVNHRDVGDAGEFTFRLELVDGDRAAPVASATWKLPDGTGGTTDADGEFTFEAAEGPVTIGHLETGKTYRVTEVEIPEFYAAVNNGVAEVMMPLYAERVKATIENNWLKRPLEVTKTLVYNYNDPNTAAEAVSAVFTMTALCDQDGTGVPTPLANKPYTVLENGKDTGTSSTTGADGTFQIKGGQTVVIEDAGLAGSVFTVTETPNETFHQVYPLNNESFTGVMNNDGGKASFINGDPNGLVLRKEWNGLDDVGEQYAAKGFSVEVSVNGNAWPSAQKEVTTVSVATNRADTKKDAWNANSPYKLNAGKLAVVTDTSDLTGPFTVTEANGHRIEDWVDDAGKTHHMLIAARQDSFTGTIETMPTVTFVNDVSEIPEASRIAKRLLNPDAKVTDGARLALQVERYDGANWVPAGNIAYIRGYGPKYNEEFLSTEIEYTGDDGKLTLLARDGKMPWAVFPYNRVCAVDVPEPETGDLRIRELAESDPQWGSAVGVGGLTNDGSYTSDLVAWSASNRPEEGPIQEAFVNVTTTMTVDIGKVAERATDEEFTFVLEQITEVDGAEWDEPGPVGEIAEIHLTPDNYNDAIKRKAVGAGVSFTVYDTRSGTLLRDGVTDEYGKFALRGGEYAELRLPENTLWTVREDVLPAFKLTGLEEYPSVEKGNGGSPRLGKLDNNLMLIGADVEYRQNAKGTVTLDLNGGAFPSSDPDGWTKGLDGKYYKENVDGNVTLPDATPERTDKTFNGWRAGDTADLKQPGESVDVAGDVTICAEWEQKPVKYAVCLYGIKQGAVEEEGKVAGLTFGPATGGDYTKNVKYCAGTETDHGDCLHWKTWEEIIAIAQTEPEKFQQCLENGCTHSVELKLSDELLLPTYKFPEMTGDGAGVLVFSINMNYRRWNNSSNGGGWPGSRMRATLNGQDEYTADGNGDVDTGGEKIYYASDSEKRNAVVDGSPLLDASNALISAFPAELQTAIVKKAVKSDTKYDEDVGSGYSFITYDKLWLFSGAELYPENVSSANIHDVRPNEGTLYERCAPSGPSETDMQVYNDSGNTSAKWWLRSVCQSDTSSVYEVASVGVQNSNLSSLTDYLTSGIAPGFCLGAVDADPCIHTDTWVEIIKNAESDPTVYEDCLKNGCTRTVELTFQRGSPLFTSEPDSLNSDVVTSKGDDSYTVKYAVALYGIKADGENTLTFGPATGGDYTKGHRCHTGEGGFEADGAGMLYGIINETYRKWNSDHTNSGGWPASMVRATLNGKENCGQELQEHAAQSEFLIEDNALISAFPEPLRNAIVPKTVESDTVSNSEEQEYVKTTSDKLWLFSGHELHTGSDSADDRPNEGETYQRATELGISGEYDKLKLYDESGSEQMWWLRSLYRTGSVDQFDVYGVGETENNQNWRMTPRAADGDGGLAPGFCIGESGAAR